jgi:GrpB-like predicted nucleotidyltransferase (UPF0157 family)
MPDKPVTEPTRLITIADWSPHWADQFAAKACAIRQALGALALRIDHIGLWEGLAGAP